MRFRVIADGVASRGNVGGDFWPSAGVAAHYKKCGGHVVTRKNVEKAWRGAGIRAVVEGEGDLRIVTSMANRGTKQLRGRSHRPPRAHHSRRRGDPNRTHRDSRAERNVCHESSILPLFLDSLVHPEPQKNANAPASKRCPPWMEWSGKDPKQQKEQQVPHGEPVDERLVAHLNFLSQCRRHAAGLGEIDAALGFFPIHRILYALASILARRIGLVTYIQDTRCALRRFLSATIPRKWPFPIRHQSRPPRASGIHFRNGYATPR